MGVTFSRRCRVLQQFRFMCKLKVKIVTVAVNRENCMLHHCQLFLQEIIKCILLSNQLGWKLKLFGEDFAGNNKGVIGGSNWRVLGTRPTPSWSKFFHFFFALFSKILSNNRFLYQTQGLAAPSGKSWIRPWERSLN